MTTTDATPDVAPHPAPFSAKVLDRFVEILRAEHDRRPGPLDVLDPFAGIGRIHDLREHVEALRTVGVELEPEWARAHPDTVVGDATNLPPEWAETFDVVATSPCYGNRMADHHEAEERCRPCGGRGTLYPSVDTRRAPTPGIPSAVRCEACDGTGRRDHVRITYRHKLGRMPSDGSAAVLQWGPAYRELHAAAWREADRVLRPGGLVVLNISNHVRRGRVMRVAEWHLVEWIALGYLLVAASPVNTPRMGFGANRSKRVDAELVLVLRKPDAGT